MLRGRGRQALLDSYALERGQAAAQVLDVSDRIHREVMGLIATASHPNPQAEALDQAADLAAREAKCLLHVCYQGSPLVGEELAGEDPPSGPAPGQRYPDRIRLTGPQHHLLVFGPEPEGLSEFSQRWSELVEVVDAKSLALSPARAGLADSGLVLVRPDGYLGFRALKTGPEALRAVENHLRSYLVVS